MECGLRKVQVDQSAVHRPGESKLESEALTVHGLGEFDSQSAVTAATCLD
jgi:hypothetical protein